MYFCVHLNLGKIIIFIEIKIHHKSTNMFMHTCWCICILVLSTFVNPKTDSNLKLKMALKQKKEKRKRKTSLSLFLACGLLSLAAQSISPSGPSSEAVQPAVSRAQRPNSTPRRSHSGPASSLHSSRSPAKEAHVGTPSPSMGRSHHRPSAHRCPSLTSLPSLTTWV